jgi:hypothetical protein
MKIYGYSCANAQKLLELIEVSFIASPMELRKLADFLISQAGHLELGEEWEHVHFSDFLDDRNMNNDVIVFNPKYIAE